VALVHSAHSPARVDREFRLPLLAGIGLRNESCFGKHRAWCPSWWPRVGNYPAPSGRTVPTPLYLLLLHFAFQRRSLVTLDSRADWAKTGNRRQRLEPSGGRLRTTSARRLGLGPSRGRGAQPSRGSPRGIFPIHGPRNGPRVFRALTQPCLAPYLYVVRDRGSSPLGGISADRTLPHSAAPIGRRP
jgi:hypothetical protein